MGDGLHVGAWEVVHGFEAEAGVFDEDGALDLGIVRVLIIDVCGVVWVCREEDAGI